MENEFELIAKTFQGLEDLLAQELAEIGANNIKKGRRVVHFTGDTETMYQANYMLRTAIRILKPLKHFSARNADEVYDTVRNYEWRNILDLKTTFAVDSVVYSENFSYSKFVAYKVKDAIVDYFRENCGKRPNISIANPDIRFHIHISDDDCTLSLDSSGESLHKRGYRVESVDAPINEVLAAGIVKLTGWNGECDYIDPMCGSATIPIEACMMARNIAPGKFRKEFAFQKWADYSESLFLSIKDSCTAQERPFEHRMYAYDVDANAVKAAKANIIAAELDEDFVVDRRDFRDFKQPTEKAIMVINPPYGVRIKSDSALPLLYKAIGERLKHQFTGNEAWIICNSEELFQNIGLKPSIKIPLFNGSLDCQLQKYQIFSGKFNEFRHEGNDIKTDRERRQMADPHRFKVHREFKKRLDEDEQADYGDIPDYVIRKHREFEENQRRKERRAARDQRRPSHPDNDGGRSFGPDARKPYAAGGRRFEHNGNRPERQDRRNFHDGKSYGRNSSHDGSRGDFRGKSGGGFRKGGERKGYKD
jgi:putative N6-adenine-specific DNA methylase